jgi:glycine betaine/proline transport system substrate-binding protein
MTTFKLTRIAGLAAGVLAAAVLVAPVGANAAEMPGEGKSVKVGRATWDTGWFQTEIYVEALKKLGYEIKGPTTLDNPALYQAIGQGDIDFEAMGWFPLHNTYLNQVEDSVELVGYVAKGGALQGYLIDRTTAEKHGITNLSDFKKPEVKKLFDTDGDGKAELVACPPGWGCELVIKHHLDAYGLRDHVDPIKAGYSASMADAISRYNDGEPIFFYTWTPNWTVGILEPGRDVVWLEVPRPDLPEDQKDLEDATTVEGVSGCVDDPCEMGWPANDIRPVVNKQFLNDNPAVRALFQEIQVPIEDIFAQNAKMYKGEDRKEDIVRHAKQWIEDNQDTFNAWIRTAKQAAM